MKKYVFRLSAEGTVRHLTDHELPALTEAIGVPQDHFRVSHIMTSRDIDASREYCELFKAHCAEMGIKAVNPAMFWVICLANHAPASFFGPFPYRYQAVEAEVSFFIEQGIPIIERKRA